jgi:hypothetical protein
MVSGGATWCVAAALWLAAGLSASAAGGNTTAPAKPQTGAFTTTFTTRCPLSAMDAMRDRLKITDPMTDYNLSKESFLVYVPEKYDPKKPLGLIVFSCYKPVDQLPLTVLPQLAAANMAFITAQDFPDQWWQRAGLALDAAFNMFHRYKIDPRRMYIFGGGKLAGTSGDIPGVAERLGLNYPEIFSGTCSVEIMNYRRVEGDNGNFWLAEIPRPDDDNFELAKSRPFVFALFSDGQEWQREVQAFITDGFENVKLTIVSPEQYHYPNFTTDWLPAVINYLDAGN